MKKVTFKGYPVTSSYTLNETTKKGFYKIETGNWIATVSKNTQKIKYFGDDNIKTIEEKVERIRKEAFGI